MYAGIFREREAFELPLSEGRHAWVHVAKGSVRVQGQALSAGDGLAMIEERSVRIEGVEGAEGEVLVFDLR